MDTPGRVGLTASMFEPLMTQAGQSPTPRNVSGFSVCDEARDGESKIRFDVRIRQLAKMSEGIGAGRGKSRSSHER